MRQNSPVKVFLLTFVTFGIYGIVWLVKTKNDLNKLGADIPTAWLLIVPFVSLYWFWKYSEGVELVTNGKISSVLAFVMLTLPSILVYPIMFVTSGKSSAIFYTILPNLLVISTYAILQSRFNKIGDTATYGGGDTRESPFPTTLPISQPTIVGPTPDGTFGNPVVVTSPNDNPQVAAPFQSPQNAITFQPQQPQVVMPTPIYDDSNSPKIQG